MARPAVTPLPAAPDPKLAEAYTCEVLRTTKGLLRGAWAHFRAEAFYRPLPDDAVRTIRQLLIAALGIETYAEREGEAVEAVLLGEGSYAHVYGCGAVAAKLVSERERPWVHKALVENSLEADRRGLGPRVFGHGRLEQSMGGHFRGSVLLMERLEPLGSAWAPADNAAVLEAAARISRVGFHNDLKLCNILRRAGRPVVIDFDLMSTWVIKVAVTTSCIEHDFRGLLEPAGEELTCLFREYYDLFALTLTLEDGPLYQAVLQRLKALWRALEEPVLRRLPETVAAEKLSEVPFEVLVRVPLQGVTVNLLDLRGNLFAHLPEASAPEGVIPEACAALPQLLRSHGVYWP